VPDSSTVRGEPDVVNVWLSLPTGAFRKTACAAGRREGGL